MIDPRLREAIRIAIELEDPPPDVSLALEKGGHEAFDAIARALEGDLLPHERVNALRRLSLLTRHACFDRKEEVLETALRLIHDDDVTVRSGAANMIVNTVRILDRFPDRDHSKPPGARPSSRARAREMLRAALVRGLSADEAAFVQQFLIEQT